MIITKEGLNLGKAIDYQDSSVVSKEIIKGKTGNVTLFAFDKAQGLSEHTAPFDALVYIAEGRADITISGKVYTAQAGDFIIMPANEPHSLKAGERFKMMLVMIRS
ncbi:MAG: cupin domain-containing protein [Candidatus Omnitrophota bacterium]|nr:cupin domain-containing protein [Candidatus Omnitrophota bacterium]